MERYRMPRVTIPTWRKFTRSTLWMWWCVLLMILLAGSAAKAQKTRGMSVYVPDPETRTDIPVYTDSWAILIGINSYRYVNQLDYAVADANAMKDLLVGNFGFKPEHISVLTDENATGEKIKKALGDLSSVGDDDRVIVFFAGHGGTIDLSTGGAMGFLVPVDGKGKTSSDLYSTGISMQTVKELSALIPAKHVLYLIDACYGGLAVSGTRALSTEEKGFIRKITTARAREILTAGGKGEQVMEKAEWGHSAFTHALLDGLGKGLADLDNDGIIRANELSDYVKRRVSMLTEGRQSPQFRSDDEGDVIFTSASTLRPPPESAEANGSLFVTSDPPAADVFVNDNPVGKTPLKLQNLAAGRASVRVSMAEYGDWNESVQLRPGEQAAVTAKLVSQFGFLSIKSIPPGADVYLNGKMLGKTPLISSRVLASRASVKVMREDYTPWQNIVTIEPGLDKSMDITLISTAGYLTIGVAPEDAEVQIDGKKVGTGSIKAFKLPVGLHDVKVQKDDYGRKQQFVNIDPDQYASLNVKLEPTVGYLTVDVTPSDAEVYVDGRKAGTGSMENFKVPVGIHDIEIRHPSYSRSVLQSVAVQPGETRKMESQFGIFTPDAIWRSAMLPGWGQMYDGAGVKGGMFMAAFLGSGAMAVLSVMNVTDKNNTYQQSLDDLRNVTSQAEYDRVWQDANAKYNDLQDAQKKRNTFFAAAGAVYALNIVDVVLFHSRGNETTLFAGNNALRIQPAFLADGRNVNVGFKVYWK